MIAYRHVTKVIAVIMAACVCLCLCAVAFSDRILAAAGNTGVSMEYETALFNTDSVLSVNILMDDADWNEMLENAAAEEYYQCDVEINGTTFYQVGIRPKGNTSLTSIVNDPTTDRYSFKLEFDHYVDGQTCFGLDKLVLNNNYADATNMKEALIYDMYQFLGADASLYNYASISVNGEYWGVYLALEAVEDSFLLRNYGVANGALYKPEGANQGGGGAASAGGADLNYTDDDPDSYETIWDGEVTSTKKADHKRVITALKNISEGNDLESYMDVDNLLRYMAVHIFSVNEDSLSGNMAHNYYLYESGGKLNLIPWDYNLSFGGMGGAKDATSVVNEAIDNAFSATSFFDTLMADEAYHDQYYAYLWQLVSAYIDGGGFDAFYERVRSQIDALVQTDPTAFYSYEEYLTAADTLYQVVKLRGESVQEQLDGTLASAEEARQSSDALVDASTLDLSAMGSMDNGGGFDRQTTPPGAQSTENNTGGAPEPPASSDADNDAANPSKPDGTPPEADAAPPDGFAPSQPDGEMPDPPGGMQQPDQKPAGQDGETRPDDPRGENSLAESAGLSENLILYGVSALILAAAMLFAVFFKRRPNRR